MDLIEYFALPYLRRLEENGIATNPEGYGYPSQLVNTWYGGEYVAPMTQDEGIPLVIHRDWLPRKVQKLTGFKSRQEVLVRLMRLGVYTPASLLKQ